MHRSTTVHELRKAMSISKLIDSSAAFPCEVPGSNSPLVVQELQIGRTRRLPAITWQPAEIQPHQYVTYNSQQADRPCRTPEIVDATKPCLYKGGDGGGRNPAAAVL
jgi:hypothetical protein